MWRWIFKDLFVSLISLVLIFFIFYMIYLSVGENYNPFRDNKEAYKNNPIGYQVLLHQYQIDLPIIERFGLWFKNIFVGDFSPIYNPTDSKSTDIPTVFFSFLGTSMQVQIPSYILGMVIGLGLGFAAGYNYASKKARGKIVDSTINGFVSLFSAVPMIVLAAFTLLIAPLINLPTQYDSKVGTDFTIKVLLLPVLISTLVSIASWTIVMRIEVAAVLSSDYIVAARSRGYSGWFIFRRYVFRNAMYPFVGRLSASYMVVFSSSYVVEVFFGVPGPTVWLQKAFYSAEINIAMFQLLFFGLLQRVLGIIGTVAQLSVNPLVKLSFKQQASFFEKFSAWSARRKGGVPSAVATSNENLALTDGGSND